MVLVLIKLFLTLIKLPTKAFNPVLLGSKPLNNRTMPFVPIVILGDPTSFISPPAIDPTGELFPAITVTAVAVVFVVEISFSILMSPVKVSTKMVPVA